MTTNLISFPEYLFLIFLVLKLIGTIDWPWLYVSLPLICWYGLIIIAAAIKSFRD